MNARVILLAAMAMALPSLAGGQTATMAPLKRTPLAPVARPACAGITSAAVKPSARDRQQARDAAASAQQAAILGDTAAALARLLDARRFDPSDADVAYRLARVYESGGTTDKAVVAFCRFLALAPSASDAADARARVAMLAKPTMDPAVDTANARFKSGLSAYDAGRLSEADSSFSEAIAMQPSWADAIYDRALSRLAQGDRTLAASDFDLYLQLNASANDRDKVAALISALRRPSPSGLQAFTLGVLVPGAGQFYTHRPAHGTLVLLLAGGAIGSTFVSKHTTVVSQQTATDPFGNSYSYSVTTRKTERPYLIPGIVLGGAVALTSAIEAAFYARGADDPDRRVSVMVVPSRTLLAMRVTF